MRKLLVAIAFLALAASQAHAQSFVTTTPGGSTGQLQYNNNGRFGGLAFSTAALAASTSALQVNVSSLMAGGATTYVAITGDTMTGNLTVPYVQMDSATLTTGIQLQKGADAVLKCGLGNYSTGCMARYFNTWAGFSIYDTEANALANGSAGRGTYGEAGIFRLLSTGYYGFSSSADAYGSGSADTAISRLSAGVLGVGTGAAGSFAGKLKATNIEVATGTLVINGNVVAPLLVKNSGGGIQAELHSSAVSSDSNIRYYDGTNSAYVGLLGGSGCGQGVFSIYAGGCRAKFAQDGFVGIGTTGSPSTKLHMSSGTLLVDGDVGALEVSSAKNAKTDVGTASNYHVFVHDPAGANGQGAGIAFGETSSLLNVGAGIIHTRTGSNSKGTLGLYTKQTTTDNADPTLVVLLGDDGSFAVGGSTFVIQGGSATVAYSMTATKFIGDGSALTGISGGALVGVSSTMAAGYVLSTGTWVDGLMTGGYFYQPTSAQRTYASELTVPHDTWTIVPYDTLVFDANSELDNTGRFTAKVAGRFTVIAGYMSKYTTVWTAGVEGRFAIFKNGSNLETVHFYESPATHTANVHFKANTVVTLAAGDYIDMRFYQNSGSTHYSESSALYNRFAVLRAP